MVGAIRRLWSAMTGAAGPAAHLALGRAGEHEAAALLNGKGYTIIGRNVVCPAGEADLVCVAPDGRGIVIVEVKTRRPGARRVRPEASVHARKQRKLRAVARYLAKANGWSGRPVRIDVVAVDWPSSPGAIPVARHHPGAVRG
jgi:putative endonuclease